MQASNPNTALVGTAERTDEAHIAGNTAAGVPESLLADFFVATGSDCARAECDSVN